MLQTAEYRKIAISGFVGIADSLASRDAARTRRSSKRQDCRIQAVGQENAAALLTRMKKPAPSKGWTPSLGQAFVFRSSNAKRPVGRPNSNVPFSRAAICKAAMSNTATSNVPVSNAAALNAPVSSRRDLAPPQLQPLRRTLSRFPPPLSYPILSYPPSSAASAIRRNDSIRASYSMPGQTIMISSA